MKNRKIEYRIFIIMICGLFVWACANKSYPEGGPKDETPPNVIAEIPESYLTKFDAKNIRIYFDEYVQLKGIAEKFVISPPQKKKPKISLRGKYVVVEFQDSLRKDITYSLDFADAIVDNNEGNPLGFYRYVFSTGNTIDTLEMAGTLVDAESNQPVIGATVYLYENLGDSIPLLEIPDYLARTDSTGTFRFTNIRERDFRVVAIKDDDRNQIYTPEAEQFAFMDSLARPQVISIIQTDTLTEDSIATRQVTAFGPTNLYLRMFKESTTQLYMTENNRTKRELLNFTFSMPAENNFAISILDTTGIMPTENWYQMEKNLTKDTINVWMTDTNVYKRDTLWFVISYLRTDSLRQWSTFQDTVKMNFTSPKVYKNKKKQNDKEHQTPMEFMNISFKSSNSQDLHKPYDIEFSRPILIDGLKNIRLEMKVDSLYQPVEYTLIQDSLRGRLYHMETKWTPEKEYRVLIDSAAIFDIYGLHNNTVKNAFKVKAKEEYGKIILKMKNISDNVLIQMYKGGNDKATTFNILSQQTVTENGKISFDYLTPGTYRFRAVIDKNKNEKWDTGLYLKHIQPEEIVYLQCDIEVRQNFDIEQEFDIKNPYIEIKKEKKIEKDQKIKNERL